MGKTRSLLTPSPAKNPSCFLILKANKPNLATARATILLGYGAASAMLSALIQVAFPYVI
jgi:hypothetical protein